MDYILAAVPKPYVAVMDGITSMFLRKRVRRLIDSVFAVGGGVGLAVNAQFRIATEKTVFAMNGKS